MWNLGVDSKWAFTDVFGLDEELLAMLPQPVVAILMLFPITDKVGLHLSCSALLSYCSILYQCYRISHTHHPG